MKDVLSVILFSTLGFALIWGSAEFVKRLGSKLPPDPPIISATAKVIAKREEKKLGAGTKYYVTFQLEGDERIELSAEGEQYGLLVEGDKVDLTYQEKKLLEYLRL